MKPKNWAQFYIFPIKTMYYQIEGKPLSDTGLSGIPEWLPKVQDEVIHQVFGRLVELENKPVPYKIGFTVGWSIFGIIELRQAMKGLKKAFGKNSRRFNKQESAEWEEFCEEINPPEEMEKAIPSVARKAFLFFLSKDREKRWSLMDGFNEGRKLYWKRPGEYYKAGKKVKVFLFLWIFWPFHEEFGNRTHLRERLTKVFGEAVTGDQRQFNDFCSYHGLTFADPGHPKLNTE
jgi:hypothetical protein